MAADPPVVGGGDGVAFTGVPHLVQNFALGASSASQVVQRTSFILLYESNVRQPRCERLILPTGTSLKKLARSGDRHGWCTALIGLHGLGVVTRKRELL